MLRILNLCLPIYVVLVWTLTANAKENDHLMKVAFPDGVKTPWVSEIKRWKKMPGGHVVVRALLKKNTPPTESNPAEVVVIADRHGKPAVIARAEVTFSSCLREESSWTTAILAVKLDLAPYNISSTVTAFGIRVSCNTSFPAGENDTDTLFLYRTTGKTLTEIFSVNVANNDRQRGPNDVTEQTAVVKIGKNSTNEFKDLIVETTIRHSLFYQEANAAVRSEKKTDRYKWLGKSYHKQNP